MQGTETSWESSKTPQQSQQQLQKPGHCRGLGLGGGCFITLSLVSNKGIPNSHCQQRPHLKVSLLHLYPMKRQNTVFFYGRVKSQTLLSINAAAEHLQNKKQTLLLSLNWQRFIDNYRRAEPYKESRELCRQLNSSTGDILRFFCLKTHYLFKLPFLHPQHENSEARNILTKA